MIWESVWWLKTGLHGLRARPAALRGRVRAWRRFWKSYGAYKHMAPAGRKPEIGDLYPCLGDDCASTPVEPTYFYQDTWAFESILRQRPKHHVDIGSHHTFVAFLSKVIPVTMVDIRPLSVSLDTLTFQRGSILGLPFPDCSLESVSSLCVVEHIGLGRYGDPLDPFGTERALTELKRVVCPGGFLYISLPVSDAGRTCFNAHRVIAEERLLAMFEPFVVVQRRYVQGARFLDSRAGGDATGCYQLSRPL